MRTRVMLLAVTAAAAARPTAAQAPAGRSFAVRKCEEPKIPIGWLRSAGGTATFRVAKDGKPDTTSLAVTKVLGISVAALRSVVGRELLACRFDMDKASGNFPVVVASEITVDSFTVDIGPAVVLNGDATPLAIEPFVPARDTMAFAYEDRRVEEKPRALNCATPTRAPTVIHATGATPAQAQADAREQIRVANLQYDAANGGSLTAVVRVGIDGKPGSQLRVIELTNPSAAQSLGNRIGSCRYVPGRILGIPVPAFLQMTVP